MKNYKIKLFLKIKKILITITPLDLDAVIKTIINNTSAIHHRTKQRNRMLIIMMNKKTIIETETKNQKNSVKTDHN